VTSNAAGPPKPGGSSNRTDGTAAAHSPAPAGAKFGRAYGLSDQTERSSRAGIYAQLGFRAAAASSWPADHAGQDWVRLRPWSAAYAAKTSVGVPPV
jgi:hypothetical protein